MLYSLSGIGHPTHRSGCVSVMFFALPSTSSRSIFFGWCCLSCLWMSFARDSSNDVFVGILLHMSCSLSSRLFSIVQMVFPLVYVLRCVLVSSGVVLVRSDLLVGCLNLGLLLLWRR